MIDLKEPLKALGLGLIVLAIILTASMFINYYLVIGGYFIIMNLIQLYKKQWTFKSFIISILVFIFVIASFKVFQRFGIGGIIIEGIFIGIMIIVTRWKRFLGVKHQIESMIWGKPLHEYIKEKEKPPKIKIKI